VLLHPLHPYTQLLLSAVPNPDAGLTQKQLPPRANRHLAPSHVGCRFADRCALAIETCLTTPPALLELKPEHLVRCPVVSPYPARKDTSGMKDTIAARIEDGHANRWFLDAIHKGEYPQDMVEHFGSDMPEIAEGDMQLMSAPIDWLGVNHYFRVVMKAGVNGNGAGPIIDQNAKYTAMGFPWEINADAFYELLMRVQRDYDPGCIFITENGGAFYDSRKHDGSVQDEERVDYLRTYIDAMGRAVQDGVPVAGYLVWSLLDNFEWARGYGRRFGIVYVDYPTLERVPKASARWYSELIAAHRERARSAGLALDA
jgi:beta-glucosidase